MNMIACIFISLMTIQNNVWQGITPLRSTRADVERILGRPAPYSKAPYASAYLTKNERVSVLYSTGPCHVEPSHGWNVPRGTVIDIAVEPKIKLKVTDLNLDKSRYEERRDPEISNVIYYTSEEDGVSITTDEGLVTTFKYGPTAKEEHLKCPRPE